MSVLNKMLRDLDARGARAAGGASPDVDSALAAPQEQRSPRRAAARSALRLAVIGSLGAAAIALTAFADFGSRPASPASDEVAEASGSAGPGATAPERPGGAPDAAPVAEPAPAAASPLPAATPARASSTAAVPVPDPSPSTPAPAPMPDPARAAAPTPAPAPAPAPPAALPAAPRAAAVRAPQGKPAAATTAAARGPAALDPLLTPPTPARIDKRAHALSAEQRVALLYRQAVDAAQTGQRLAAIAKAREVLAAAPQHVAARQLAAALEHEAGAPNRAAELLREGLALTERGSAAAAALALPLARLLAAEGLPDEALALLDESAAASAEAQGLRAGVLARRGDHAGALAAYEAAARAQPLQPMWWLGLGVTLESLGEPARARQAFAKAHTIGLPREDLASYVEQRLRALD